MGRHQELLLEALLLRAKYSDDELRAVAEVLESGANQETLATTLELISKLELPGKKAKNKNNPKPKQHKVVSQLELLQQHNPILYSVINDFYSKLLSREVLPEAKDLRQLMDELGLKDASTKRREQNIKLIIESLSSLPIQQVQSIVEIKSKKSTGEPSDFGIIADAILRRNS